MEGYKKVKEVEILFGTLFVLFFDLTCALLDATAVGALFVPVLQTSVVFVMERWLKQKGNKGMGEIGWRITRYISTLLPLIPTTLLTFAILVFTHNHPKITGIAQSKLGSKIGAKIGAVAK